MAREVELGMLLDEEHQKCQALSAENERLRVVEKAARELLACFERRGGGWGLWQLKEYWGAAWPPGAAVVALQAALGEEVG